MPKNEAQDFTKLPTTCIREAPMKKGALYLGIAQIAIAPPPFTQTGTLGHLFSGTIFTILKGCMLPEMVIYGLHLFSNEFMHQMCNFEACKSLPPMLKGGTFVKLTFSVLFQQNLPI